MISAPGDGATSELLATDMEISLRMPLTAETVRPGAVVLPARLLLDVVRSLPSAELTIELRSAEQDVELVCGAATFHLRTLRAEDFPTLPTPSQETRVALPAPALTETISRVARSASRDETRPVLTGVLMSASDGELRLGKGDAERGRHSDRRSRDQWHRTDVHQRCESFQSVVRHADDSARRVFHGRHDRQHECGGVDGRESAGARNGGPQ